MAITRDNNVIRCTESGDTLFLGGTIDIKGTRLIAGSGADAVAKVYDGANNGATVMMSMAAAQKTADDSQICYRLDSGSFYVEITGAGAELYIYLK